MAAWQLATIKEALGASKTPLRPPSPPAGQPAVNLDTAQLDQTMAARAMRTAARTHQITEAGVTLAPAGPLGLATSVAFQPTGSGKAAITGDVRYSRRCGRTPSRWDYGLLHDCSPFRPAVIGNARVGRCRIPHATPTTSFQASRCASGRSRYDWHAHAQPPGRRIRCRQLRFTTRLCAAGLRRASPPPSSQSADLDGGNWQLLDELAEIESGKRNDRPELEKAVAACKKHRAKLVIPKLDRLSCNVDFVATLLERKVDFVCCDNPTATKFTIHIFAAVAEFEHDVHRREVIGRGDRTPHRLSAGRAAWRRRCAGSCRA